MSDEHAKTWLGKLTKLNPNVAKPDSGLRGKAPHKPLLLLCLLDMIRFNARAGRHWQFDSKSNYGPPSN